MAFVSLMYKIKPVLCQVVNDRPSHWSALLQGEQEISCNDLSFLPFKQEKVPLLTPPTQHNEAGLFLQQGVFSPQKNSHCPLHPSCIFLIRKKSSLLAITRRIQCQKFCWRGKKTNSTARKQLEHCFSDSLEGQQRHPFGFYAEKGPKDSTFQE